MSQFWKYIQGNWERVLFGSVGAACLVFTFIFLSRAEVPSASIVFLMSFFSFFYANLARFKKFKGLGFEAELWEDKQKEAAHLIDRLKNVVSIYTREIVMNKVMSGRWGGSDTWQKRWDLFDELKGRHTELGQRIDFSDLHQDIESVFIFDLCSPLASAITRSIDEAKVKANKLGTARFGSPITDLEGWNAFQSQLNSVSSRHDKLFERAKSENIARNLLTIAQDAQATLKAEFSVEIELKDGVIERLSTLSNLVDKRPVPITQELIAWADDHDASSD